MAAAGSLIWAMQNATISTTNYDKVPSIGTDGAGNTYVSYTTDGTVSGGSKLSGYDIVVLKLNSSGNILWIKQNSSFNTNSTENWSKIVVDNDGNSYICYRCEGGTVSGQTNTGNSYDIVLFKLDTTGNVVWVKQNSTFNTNNDDKSPTIALDKSGTSLYLAYHSTGTISGGVRTTNAFMETGGTDIIVCKFNAADGILQWAKQNLTFNTLYPDIFSTPNDKSPTITVDINNNVIVAYYTSGVLSGKTRTGGRDLVVFKLDSSGNTLWAKQDNTLNTSNDEGYDDDNNDAIKCSVTTDSSGDIYVYYYTSGTLPAGGTGNLIVSKLNSSGITQWVHQTGMTSGSGHSNTVLCDNSGNLILIWSTGSIQFKSLNTSGGALWNKTDVYGNIGESNFSACLDSSGNICLAHQTWTTISGGTNAGSNDIVVSKFVGNGPRSLPGASNATAPNAPSITSVSAGDKQATINFTVPADNGSAITSYTVTSTPDSITATGTGTSITVTGLSNGVSYTFVVTATNGIGTSAASNASSAVTPIAASSDIAVSETSLSISSFINAQTTSTEIQQNSLIINLRNSLKNGVFANNTAKANAKKAYIDAMRTKLGKSTQTIPSTSFTSFTSTLTSVANDISANPITLVYPLFDASNSAEIDVSTVTASSYLFFEVPVGFSVIFKNGASSLLMTYNGTNYQAGAVSYSVGDSFTVGGKSVRFIGFGSGGLQDNGGGGGAPICFLGNAPVLTPTGYRRIDSLVAGDAVKTATGKTVSIQRVTHQHITTPSHSVNPYIIPTGMFGATQNLAISPRHCVAVPGKGMCEARSLGLKQITMKEAFDYYNIELPDWENIVVAGVEVESLAPVKEVVITKEQLGVILSKMSVADRSKIMRLISVKNNGGMTLQLTKSRKH